MLQQRPAQPRQGLQLPQRPPQRPPQRLPRHRPRSWGRRERRLQTRRFRNGRRNSSQHHALDPAHLRLGRSLPIGLASLNASRCQLAPPARRGQLQSNGPLQAHGHGRLPAHGLGQTQSRGPGQARASKQLRAWVEHVQAHRPLRHVRVRPPLHTAPSRESPRVYQEGRMRLLPPLRARQRPGGPQARQCALALPRRHPLRWPGRARPPARSHRQGLRQQGQARAPRGVRPAHGNRLQRLRRPAAWHRPRVQVTWVAGHPGSRIRPRLFPGAPPPRPSPP